MTKLHHDRLLLKYLDNFHRENRRTTLLNQSLMPKPKARKSVPRRLDQPKNEQAYMRHLEVFEGLPDQSKGAIYEMLNKGTSLLGARHTHISSLGSGKHASKREEQYNDAYASFRVACATYNNLCKTELKDGKSISRQWWAKLRVVMGEEWSNFEEFDELINETR